MHAFETPGRVTLRVRLPAGRVVLAAAEGPRTTVELVSPGGAPEDVVVRAEEGRRGHVIVVEQRGRFRWGPLQLGSVGVEARIACPPGSDLELAGAATEVEAEVDLGAVSARTASGGIRLAAVDTLLVKAASGDVSVGPVAEATVRTVAGGVAVESVERTLNARSVSGDVRVGRARGRVVVSTASGDVEVDAVEAGEVRAQTVSGDVRLAVAPGTRVWIDATSVSGSLSSELELSDEAGDAEEGVVPLHVRTVSGAVRIARAAVPA
ncbi:MAG TPA: DUF4097 family beta strand repeat-containing protein [Vicinamibacterales bacterium]|nr:DUF4097 family beta strand repeat-containing protein [Vicinamibacterales bacterium]